MRDYLGASHIRLLDLELTTWRRRQSRDGAVPPHSHSLLESGPHVTLMVTGLHDRNSGRLYHRKRDGESHHPQGMCAWPLLSFEVGVRDNITSCSAISADQTILHLVRLNPFP